MKNAQKVRMATGRSIRQVKRHHGAPDRDAQAVRVSYRMYQGAKQKHKQATATLRKCWAALLKCSESVVAAEKALYEHFLKDGLAPAEARRLTNQTMLEVQELEKGQSNG